MIAELHDCKNDGCNIDPQDGFDLTEETRERDELDFDDWMSAHEPGEPA